MEYNSNFPEICLGKRCRFYSDNPDTWLCCVTLTVRIAYPIINETRIDLYFIPLLPRSLLSYRFSFNRRIIRRR